MEAPWEGAPNNLVSELDQRATQCASRREFCEEEKQLV